MLIRRFVGPQPGWVKRKEQPGGRRRSRITHPERYHLDLDVAEAYERSTVGSDIVQNLLALLDVHRADVAMPCPISPRPGIQP